MTLVKFIRRAEPKQLRKMLLLTVVAGIANAALIMVVIHVATIVANAERPSVWEWGGFLGAFAVYYIANQFALVGSVRIIEDLLNQLRLHVTDHLRKTELRVVDKLGRGRLYTLIAKETNHLSVTFPLLIDAFQQLMLLFVALCYLLYLSPEALFIFLVSVFLGVLGYQAINKRFRRILQLVERLQAEILDAIVDIIRGAKELRLNNKRSEAVSAAYRKRSDLLERFLVRSVEHWVSLILLGAFVTFAMLAVVVFGFPNFVSDQKVLIFQITPVLLFCMGTLTKTVSQSPMFLRAEVGLQSILEVVKELSNASSISPDETRIQATKFIDFSTIAFSGIRFRYDDQNPNAYAVGPLDLTVRRGEVIFLVGGNGSGKSTALKMMTGLYPIRTGSIVVDDTAVSGTAIGGYRELFSAVLAEFHLFDRLYGVEDTDPARVNGLLSEWGLADKVSYEDGQFSQLDLSTGQRKRLALIAAILEDRPVYVFDEWSAEQDVHFREYFYTKLIPDLRDQGKLVIATTHDEKYWNTADRVVKLDLGQIEWVKKPSEMDE